MSMAMRAAMSGLIRERVLLVLGGAVAALAVWVVAVPVAGVDLRVNGGTLRVEPVAVAVTTLVAGALGMGLLALLERFTRRARAIWVTVALIVLVLSLAGPLGAVSPGAMLALGAMHLVVGAVLIGAVASGRAIRAR